MFLYKIILRKTNGILMAGVKSQSAWDDQTSSLNRLNLKRRNVTRVLWWRLPVFLQRLPVRLLLLVCWFHKLCTRLFFWYLCNSIFSPVVVSFLYARWSCLCAVARCVRYTCSMCEPKPACLTESSLSVGGPRPKLLHSNVTLLFPICSNSSIEMIGVVSAA